jgi:dynein regulatory complex protein 1
MVAADRILWEQQLGNKWTCPPQFQKLLDWGHSSEPAVSDAVSNTDGTFTDSASTDAASRGNTIRPSSATVFSQQQLAQLMNKDSTKQVLELLTAESASFLVEEKLHKLLAPLRREEQNLMKLDSIFKALNVQTIKDVERLQSHFLKEVHGNTAPDAASATLVELVHPNEVLRAVRKFVEESRALAAERVINLQNGTAVAQQQQQQSLEKTEEEKFAFWSALHEAVDLKNFHVWTVCAGHLRFFCVEIFHPYLFLVF